MASFQDYMKCQIQTIKDYVSHRICDGLTEKEAKSEWIKLFAKEFRDKWLKKR